MKRISPIIALILLLIIAGSVSAATEICHKEDGKPDKTLIVPDGAVTAHMAQHGDYLGPCVVPATPTPAPTATPLPTVVPTNTPLPTSTPVIPPPTPTSIPSTPVQSTNTPIPQTGTPPTTTPVPPLASTALPHVANVLDNDVSACAVSCCAGQEAYYFAMADEVAVKTEIWEQIADYGIVDLIFDIITAIKG